VRVTDVADDSPTRGMISSGDIIQQVNRSDIGTTADFEKAVAGIGPKDTILLLIYRNNGAVYLTIKP